MRFCNYFKTPLEQSIQDVYLENGILVPEDLAIDRIARIFQIDVVFEQIITFSDNQLMIIFLQSGIEQTEQRKSFYHELGHVLRHAGDQRFMSKLFGSFKKLMPNDSAFTQPSLSSCSKESNYLQRKKPPPGISQNCSEFRLSSPFNAYGKFSDGSLTQNF